jgi:hypothetical protein
MSSRIRGSGLSFCFLGWDINSGGSMGGFILLPLFGIVNGGNFGGVSDRLGMGRGLRGMRGGIAPLL